MRKYLFKRGKDECKSEGKCKCHTHGCGSLIYVLGFIGASIYFTTSANNFGEVILGLLKALAWPAFLVYGLLKQLGM